MICVIYKTQTGHVFNVIESGSFPDGFCAANTPPDCSHVILPSDALPPGQRHKAWSVMDGELVAIAEPAPTEAQVRASLIAAAQSHLDEYAQSWGYDDLRSAVTYVGDPYPRFNAEGLALRNWRSAVWAWLDAQATQPLPDPLPTSAEFIALLPAPPARP
jgi:hypothetical protein